MIYQQLPMNYRSLRNQKYAAESGAQRKTLQGRKHIYKNILGSDSALGGCILKCVQLALSQKKVYGIFA
jgi:hypothetical protein